MSIYEKQQEKFGGVCNWLDCDCNCHMTKCVKNNEFMWHLLDRFKELNLKHPEFAIELYKDYCNDSEFKCFEKVDKNIDRNFYDEEKDLTAVEMEAIKLAKETFKDDEYVKSLYEEGRQKYITREKERIEKELKKIKEIENEQS